MMKQQGTWAPVQKQRQGFTLLEVLLVVAILALLAGIVIVAINPGRQLANSRNSQRSNDIKNILNAIYQYNIDNGGIMPATITTTATDVCNTTGANCTGEIDLGVLTASGKYIIAMPKDPQCSSLCATYATGYKVIKDVNNRITVSSTYAEQGATISISR